MYNKRFIADKQRSIKELYGHSVCWRRYGSTGSGTMSSNLQGYKTRYALGCTCLADYKLMATECYMREFCIRHGIVKLSILLYTEGYRLMKKKRDRPHRRRSHKIDRHVRKNGKER